MHKLREFQLYSTWYLFYIVSFSIILQPFFFFLSLYIYIGFALKFICMLVCFAFQICLQSFSLQSLLILKYLGRKAMIASTVQRCIPLPSHCRGWEPPRQLFWYAVLLTWITLHGYVMAFSNIDDNQYFVHLYCNKSIKWNQSMCHLIIHKLATKWIWVIWKIVKYNYNFSPKPLG